MSAYDDQDTILNIIEQQLLSVAGRKNLTGSSIERWRWDEPEITLRWWDTDKRINKSIHVWISNAEGPGSYELVTEINAWRDEDRKEGKIRERHWGHLEIGRVCVDPIRPEKGTLSGLVETAYDKVSEWSTGALTKEPHILRVTGL